MVSHKSLYTPSVVSPQREGFHQTGTSHVRVKSCDLHQSEKPPECLVWKINRVDLQGSQTEIPLLKGLSKEKKRSLKNTLIIFEGNSLADLGAMAGGAGDI